MFMGSLGIINLPLVIKNMDIHNNNNSNLLKLVEGLELQAKFQSKV
jgi:hypothetical protein